MRHMWNMDTLDIVNALAELGLLGAVLIGGSAVFFIMRRDRKNGNGVQPLIDMFVENQERIATSQERMVVSFERMLEGQKTIQHGLTELVELHIKMEARREVLGKMVDEGGHS